MEPPPTPRARLSLLGAEFTPGASFELARASYAEFPQIVPDLEAATGMDLLYQRRPSLRLALDDDEAGLIQGTDGLAGTARQNALD